MSRTAWVSTWASAALVCTALCVTVGILFDEAALWGAAAVVSVLYIGALTIAYSRRPDRSPGTRSQAASPPLRDGRGTVPPSTGTAISSAGRSVTIGSPDFSSLAHELAGQVDDPVDILDAARRAGIRMGSLRSSGAQTPLNLWTAVLTRAVRDGCIDRLRAEVARSEDLGSL